MDEQQLQQQIVQLVQAAMQGDQQATQLIQQIMQAAQLGDQQAAQLAQMIQQVAQQMQLQQVQAAKFGAKLNYIKQLRGVCPDGYEMLYFRSGGRFCKQCVKKQKKMEDGGTVPSNPVDAFKCGRKMKKAENGSKVPAAKDGKKLNYTSKKTKGEEVMAGSPIEWYDKPVETLIDAQGNRYMSRVVPAPGDTVFVEPNFVTMQDPRYPIYRDEFNKNWNPTEKKKKKISKKFGGGVLEAPSGLGAIGARAAAQVVPRKKIVWSAEDPTTGIDPSGVVVHRSLGAVGALSRRQAMQDFANDIYTEDLNIYNEQRQTVRAAQQKADDFKNKVLTFTNFN